MGKRELTALLNLSSWCLVMVEQLFLGMPRGCLQFVIVVLPDHTHLLFLILGCFRKKTAKGVHFVIPLLRKGRFWQTFVNVVKKFLTLFSNDPVFKLITFESSY